MRIYLILLVLTLSCEKKNFPAVYSTEANSTLREPSELSTLNYHQVRDKNGKEFFTTNREDKITQFACSNCHKEPLPAEEQRKFKGLMHIDIKLQHASEEVMDCTQCHNEKNLNTLKLNNGTAISINESYRLCSQCHFQQEKDWRGGAHGKRYAGWFGKRVIYNCTDCHDPHNPAFKQQFPVGRPTIPRTGQGVSHEK